MDRSLLDFLGRMRFPARLAPLLLTAAALAGVANAGCRALQGATDASTTSLSSAATPLEAPTEPPSALCAESLAAFTAADVRARLDVHGVVAKVEPGVSAKQDRLGLLCEATLEVSWHVEGAGERVERVRLVAHRHASSGELAVLVHEAAAPRSDTATAEAADVADGDGEPKSP